MVQRSQVGRAGMAAAVDTNTYNNVIMYATIYTIFLGIVVYYL